MSKQAKNAAIDTLAQELKSAGFLRVCVHLTPKAAHDEVKDWVEDADGARWLAVRVRALPEDGAANDALIKLLAKTLRTPKTGIAITKGHTSRYKTIEIHPS